MRQNRNSTCPSDETLFLGFVEKGSSQCLERLVERYSSTIQQFLAGYCGDWHLAEDAVQLTWFKVAQNREKFQQGRSFRPWLFTIAKRCVGDLIRRTERHRIISLDARLSSDTTVSIRRLVPNSEKTPDEVVQQVEAREAIREHAASLPQPQRNVLDSVYFNGASYAETSESIGVPLGTVKSRLHAAIKQLRLDLKSA